MKATYHRRNFIQAATMMTAGSLILPHWACNNSSKTGEAADASAMDAAETPKPSLSNFGLQLYTLREDMPKDPKGVLKQIASFGYTQIEGYEGDQGLFWNMSPADFKSYIGDLGLHMISSHCNINENFATKAAQSAEVGLKYLICPYIGPQKTMDDWKKVVDQFNECGKVCKENGIRFAYHNHEYSFVALDGVFPQDYMMDNTDPALVDFEMDIYWVVTGGADPLAYLKKYPNRFKLCHVKDRMAGTDERDASCDLGKGIIDYPAILGEMDKAGMMYYIVEQERYDNSTPLKSAAADAAYLKNLVFS